MDINLKNNKSLNLRILILGILITLLPIFLSTSSGYGFNYIASTKFLVILNIVITIFLLADIIIEKNLTFKETSIITLYDKLFLEIRALLVIVTVYLLFALYDIMLWVNIFTTPDNLIEFIVTLLLSYLSLIDIYKLYMFNEANKFENYIYEKSMLYKLFKLTKKCFPIRSTVIKMILPIIIFIIYVILIYILGCSSIYHLVSSSDSISLKLIIVQFITSGPLIITFFIFSTVAIILYFIYINWDINIINTATHNIAKGKYNNKLEVKSSFILKDIATNIMAIEDGLNKAIDKAIKSEKMKSELITNVSHDLKTPLTSIISYVDLLDNTNISETKRKLYLGILKERSLRLKILIEDLFEASKAASGVLEMHMDDLDPVALIRQTLGEFEDEIKVSDLHFIKRIPEKKLTIYADGKKTFRVFQNLVSNIIKYSLKGTRVYIDIEEANEYVSITFKNISSYPLNFTEEEILERFKRGDSSRATEGSGLGLSIAKSLVVLQGGLFKLKFDGDLFKVIILLKNKNFNLKYV